METDYARLSRLAKTMAFEAGVHPNHIEDVVQEAAIAAWRTDIATRANDKVAFTNGIMRRRIMGAKRDRDWCGKPPHKGRMDALDYTEDVVEFTGRTREPEDPDERVRQAVARLAFRERQYIWLRFYLGAPAHEYNPLRESWRSAKRKLRKELGNEV